MTKTIALFSAALLASTASTNAMAATVFIGFDSSQAGYTPTPGVIQNVSNQFGSLGVIFRDQKTPGQGATLGRCGPGNGPVAFFGFGNDFAGCGDTQPDIDIDFVNPLNNALDGFTTSFSILNFDGLIRATAFDSAGAVLGFVQNTSGVLSLSGIGNISRVNLQSIDQDPTTLDDLNFEAVIGVNGAVPEPASWALMIAGFGLVGSAMRRRKPSVSVSFA
jgi:hypothetical protein